MTIKRVNDYNLFATGDAAEYSMAGEPRFMRDDLTPSKHYSGYITDVDAMHHEFTIAITNDRGEPIKIRHYADPVREPIGIPVYFYMEVLLDKETFVERLRSREKREIKYAKKNYDLAVEVATKRRDDAFKAWDTLTDR